MLVLLHACLASRRLTPSKAAMSMIILAPILGGACGPAIAGAIAETLGWRKVLWMTIILATICELVFLTCLRETYSVTILRRRVARLQGETGNFSLRSALEVGNPEADEKGSKKVWDSVLRPFVVFSSSNVLQAISLFGSVMFTYFYIMSTTLPDVLSGIYGLSPALTGSSFIVFSMCCSIPYQFPVLTLHRHWFKPRHNYLQPPARQDLYSPTRQYPFRPRPARIPPPTSNLRRHHPSPLGSLLWLGSTTPLALTSHPASSWCPRLHHDVHVSPDPVIRRRCFWDIFGKCTYSSHRHEMSYEHLSPIVCGALGTSAGMGRCVYRALRD